MQREAAMRAHRLETVLSSSALRQAELAMNAESVLACFGGPPNMSVTVIHDPSTKMRENLPFLAEALAKYSAMSRQGFVKGAWLHPRSVSDPQTPLC